jgi:rubrerythrin
MDKVQARTIKKIKGALHEEKEAISDYRKDAKKVDPKTAKLMREIARDETTHKRQLTKRLGIVSKR